MLAEELPQLLQTLLVGVERVICRLPLEDLSFPPSSTTAKHNSHDTHEPYSTAAAICTSPDGSHQGELDIDGVHNRRPLESGLKRRELITKNKMMGTKYALLRAIKNENNSPQSGAMAGDSLGEGSNGMGMCLGGGLAFPHIDSDEESVEDVTKKCITGK